MVARVTEGPSQASKQADNQQRMGGNLHQAQAHDILRSWHCRGCDVNNNVEFVLPMFIINDDDKLETIESMPEVGRYGCNQALAYLEPLVRQYKLRAVLLFPVIAKSEQPTHTFDHGEDDDDEEVSSSTFSSSPSTSSDSSSSLSNATSQSVSRSSSSLSAFGGNDNGDAHQVVVGRRDSRPSVTSERLVPGHRRSGNDADDDDDDDRASLNTNSQNPFLDENEGEGEEATHLLADQGDRAREDDQVAQQAPRSPLQPQPPSTTVRAPTPPPRLTSTAAMAAANAAAAAAAARPPRRPSKQLDIQLIKSFALKDKRNPVLRLIPRLRAKFPELLIICDVCLCAFTSTGHCCLFDDERARTIADSRPTSAGAGAQQHGSGALASTVRSHIAAATATAAAPDYPISCTATCRYLALLARAYALRGCHVVAPSDMIDGRIEAIRKKLDKSGLRHVAIMSYAAKFASACYGPFREAAGSAPAFGDRRAYQLPPGSRWLAMRAVRRDIEQGADILMVKPAGHYLDIVRDMSNACPELPIAVYQVSGEYAMIQLAAAAHLIDLKQFLHELFTSFRRAGATVIITYFTPKILRGELRLSSD